MMRNNILTVHPASGVTYYCFYDETTGNPEIVFQGSRSEWPNEVDGMDTTNWYIKVCPPALLPKLIALRDALNTEIDAVRGASRKGGEVNEQ